MAAKVKINPETIKNLYWNKGLTAKEIATKFNIHETTIYRFMKRNKIPLKHPNKGKSRDVKIKNLRKFREYIDGLLLGDGSICIDRRNKSLSPSFMQGVKVACSEWVWKIKRDINKFGLICSVDGPYNNPLVRVRTQVHPFFLRMRKRWYPNGKKKVPKDLVITPIILGNWFLGDGKLDKDDMITIYTESFSFNEVKFLSSLINKIVGITSYVKKNEQDNPVIKVRAKESSIFLSFIPKEFRLKCFLYKFNIKATHRRMKWLPSEDELLGKMYGKTPTEVIAKELRRSVSSIYHRTNRLGLEGR